MDTVSVKKTSNIQVVEMQITLQDGHCLVKLIIMKFMKNYKICVFVYHIISGYLCMSQIYAKLLKIAIIKIYADNYLCVLSISYYTCNG